MSSKTALIIQGIKALGKENINPAVIKKLNALLTEEEKRVILKESKPVTVWVYKVIRKICEGERNV